MLIYESQIIGHMTHASRAWIVREVMCPFREEDGEYSDRRKMDAEREREVCQLRKIFLSLMRRRSSRAIVISDVVPEKTAEVI